MLGVLTRDDTRNHRGSLHPRAAYDLNESKFKEVCSAPCFAPNIALRWALGSSLDSLEILFNFPCSLTLALHPTRNTQILNVFELKHLLHSLLEHEYVAGHLLQAQEHRLSDLLCTLLLCTLLLCTLLLWAPFALLEATFISSSLRTTSCALRLTGSGSGKNSTCFDLNEPKYKVGHDCRGNHPGSLPLFI